MGYKGSRFYFLYPLYPFYYIVSAMRTTVSIVLNFLYSIHIDISYQPVTIFTFHLLPIYLLRRTQRGELRLEE